MKRRAQTGPFHLILILLCAGLMVQCGDSDDPDPLCDPSLLADGDYVFSLGTVSDGCAGGVLAGFIRDEYPEPRPEMSLPAFDELPATISMNLPFVGMVQADLLVSGNDIRMDLTPSDFLGTMTIPLVGPVDYDLSASGILCPVSTTKVEVTLVLDVHRLEALGNRVSNCRLVIPLSGDLL
jgi:hypothetical protein